MRMQRCSISAVCGYSAWSMKFRWRFSAITRCASGSIQVVTKVARLRDGNPVEDQVLADQPHGVDGGHAVLRQLVIGRRLQKEAIAELAGERVEMLDGHRNEASSRRPRPGKDASTPFLCRADLNARRATGCDDARPATRAPAFMVMPVMTATTADIAPTPTAANMCQTFRS